MKWKRFGVAKYILFKKEGWIGAEIDAGDIVQERMNASESLTARRVIGWGVLRGYRKASCG